MARKEEAVRQAGRHWRRGRRRRGLRPLLIAGLLLAVGLAFDPAVVEPPAFLSAGPERVDQRFTRCGPGRGHACVIDGDTFKLGARKVRIIGIDAPEVNGRCLRESQLAAAATARLQALLNQGPFEMTAPLYGASDRYGRDLRVLRREVGTRQVSIAGEMRASGHARRYFGGFRSGWC